LHARPYEGKSFFNESSDVLSAIYIHPSEARRLFTEFAHQAIDASNLARGALLIALEDYPQLNIDAALSSLDEIGNRIARKCQGEPPIFKVGRLHGEMFDNLGFHGNDQDYYDVRNVYLNEVIERKTGIPITLSIIFLHLARILGLNASGVGLPGHYVVKVQFELNEIYVDPFNGGTTLTVPEIRNLLKSLGGQDVELRSEHLRSWNERDTLLRVLANLQNFYSRRGDQKRSMSARERMEILRAS